MQTVLVATPAYGGMVSEPYFQSVLNLTAQAYSRGLQVDVLTLSNESLITRARNDIVAAFMRGDWTDLLWIDADIQFTPEHAFRLLEAPHEVCATPYPMKRINWDAAAAAGGTANNLKSASALSVVNSIDGAEPDDGFVRCLDAGTGFMRVTRPALQRLIAAHPELQYQSDMFGSAGTRWAIFDTMLADGRYLSEDYAFCRRWQQIGGEIWVDVKSPILSHHGSYTFGG